MSLTRGKWAFTRVLGLAWELGLAAAVLVVLGCNLAQLNL